MAGAAIAGCGGGAGRDRDAALDPLAPVESESSSPSVGATSTSTSSIAPVVGTVPTPPSVPLELPTEVDVVWEPDGTPELPAAMVKDAVLASSIGDLHVTFVSNAEGTELADLWGIVPAPHGFVTVWDGHLLMSADAVRWQPVDSPFSGRLLWLSELGPDEFSLGLYTPEGVVQRWTSGDLERWSLVVESSDVELFTGLLDGPGLIGADFGQPLPLPNGSTLTWVTVGIDIRRQLVARLGDADTRLRFAERGSEIWWEPEPGGLSGRLCAAVITTRSWGTCAEASAGSVASVEVDLSITGAPDAWVLDVVDPASRDSLGVVRGSAIADDLEAILEMVALTGITDWFVIDGGMAERVAPDWADPTDPRYQPSFTETAGGLLVYDSLGSVATGETDIWRTTDGRAWEYLSGDGRREHTGYSVSHIDVSPAGGLVATVYGPGGAVTILLSDDGVGWRPSTRPPVPPAYPDPTQSANDPMTRVSVTDRGFVYFTQGGNQLAVWTSPDGDVWEPVDVSTFASVLDSGDPFEAGGGYGTAAAGSVVTVSVMSTGGDDTRWVIAVE
jgi:hypothetical protein